MNETMFSITAYNGVVLALVGSATLNALFHFCIQAILLGIDQAKYSSVSFAFPKCTFPAKTCSFLWSCLFSHSAPYTKLKLYPSNSTAARSIFSVFLPPLFCPVNISIKAVYFPLRFPISCHQDAVFVGHNLLLFLNVKLHFL